MQIQCILFLEMLMVMLIVSCQVTGIFAKHHSDECALHLGPCQRALITCKTQVINSQT